MKFLCPNCKAKYQISDEKIAGRTLKMDCRRCSHPIVIRGNKGAGREGSISSPSRRPGSHVGAAPSRSGRGSALGSDFRKQVSAPPPAQRPTALDQWHVAINDVPVGPMKREEVAHKMASGAITGESLCWREGFDDWRPVRKVPDLAALLRKHQGSGAGNAPAPPPPPKPAFPSPGRPLGAGARPARPPAARLPSPPRSSADRPAARGSSPGQKAPSNVVPIGGRLGASAAPALDDEPSRDFMDEDEPTRVGSAAQFDALAARSRDEGGVGDDEGRLSGPGPIGARDDEGVEPEGAAGAPAAELGPEEDAFDPFASVPPDGADATERTASDGSSPSAAAAAAGSSPEASSSPGLAPAGGSSPGAADGASAVAPAVAPAPMPAEAVPERRRRAIPIGAWIAIAGSMAFGVALAVMVGTHLLTQPQAVAVAPPAPAPSPDPADAVEPDLALPDPEGPDEPAEPDPAVDEAPADDAPAETGQGTARPDRDPPAERAGRAGRGAAERSAPQSDGLTDAQREALARAAGDDGAGPAQIRGGGSDILSGGGGGGGGADLTGDQIRTVVTRNRSRVQQCYEVEARRSGTAPSVRVNAQVTIGASGAVQRVNAQGGSFGNLGTCIERTVRRWHFPRSSGPTTTAIPFVFSGRD